MEAADLLLSTSGTATLEAAFFATPMVIIYKTSWLSYTVGKLVIKIPYVGLPNIIAEEKIVPELLQGAANSQEIAKQALNILDSSTQQQEIEAGLKQVKEKLGTSGAVHRVAKLVLKTGGMMNEIC
jgi:lipid-A-disaccharide synthase